MVDIRKGGKQISLKVVYKCKEIKCKMEMWKEIVHNYPVTGNLGKMY